MEVDNTAWKKKLTPQQKAEYRAEKREEMQSLFKKIDDGVKAVFESESYKECLRYMSKFTNYSAGNCILIMLQKPNANYENILNNHILPVLGGEHISALTASRINEFIHFKLTNGRLNGKGGLSAKSVRDILTVYRSIEHYAYREYGIRESNFTMPKTEQHYTDVLTPVERRRLENYLINNMSLTNLAVLLCLFTGLRIGELCGLKWEDIDFSACTLSVKRTVQRITKNGKSQVVIGSPKSRTSVRVVPIPEFLMTLLMEYKSFGGFYIITNSVKPTEPRTMQNRFKSILKACGIRNVNFHLLKHTYASVCIEKGFDPKALSEPLGHADAAITLNRYVHSSMEIKKDYVSRLCLSA